MRKIVVEITLDDRLRYRLEDWTSKNIMWNFWGFISALSHWMYLVTINILSDTADPQVGRKAESGPSIHEWDFSGFHPLPDAGESDNEV